MPSLHEKPPFEACAEVFPRQKLSPQAYPTPPTARHTPVSPAPSKLREFVDLISKVIILSSPSSSTSNWTSSSSSSSYKITTPISNPDAELHFAKLRLILTYWAEISLDSSDEAHDLARTIGGILRPLLRGLREDVPLVVAELVSEICEQSLKGEGEPYWDELLASGNLFVQRAEAKTMDIWNTTTTTTITTTSSASDPPLLTPAEEWAQDEQFQIDTDHREKMLAAESRAWSERYRVRKFERTLIATLRGDDSNARRSRQQPLMHAVDLEVEPWWQASDAGIVYDDRKLQWWRSGDRRAAWWDREGPWPKMILKNERVRLGPYSGW